VEIARLKHKLSNVVPDNAGVFDASVSDRLVPCEQYPSVSPYEREPYVIGCAAGKVCEMSFVPNTILTEGF